MCQEWREFDSEIEFGPLGMNYLQDAPKVREQEANFPPVILSDDSFIFRSYCECGERSNDLYSIPRDDCRSKPDILMWAHQLCEKSWMKLHAVRKFIEMAIHSNGLQLQPERLS